MTQEVWDKIDITVLEKVYFHKKFVKNHGYLIELNRRKKYNIYT